MKGTQNSFINDDYIDIPLPQIENRKFIKLQTVTAFREAKNLTTLESANKLVDVLKQDSKGLSYFIETIKTMDQDKPYFDRWATSNESMHRF